MNGRYALLGAEMADPKITILITTYNENDCIISTAKSILNQSFIDYELLIVDDGSKDNTIEKLLLLKNLDQRIIVICSEHIGRSNALNLGIDRSRGKYIAIMDSGDIASNDRLKKEVEFLDKNTDIFIVGTWAYWIDSKRAIIGEWKPPIIVNKKNVYRAGGTIHSTIMCRRDLFMKIGKYDPRLTSAIDNDLYIRAIKHNLMIANIPEFLEYLTWRKKGICGNTRSVEKNLLKVKLRYLRFFLNFNNVLYTFMSLLGYLLPMHLLDQMRRQRM